ncbi:MAG: NAD-dependent DNA ligase LigA [Sphaerochaeta sp.]
MEQDGIERIKRAEELRNVLTGYQRAYYVEGRPVVSDLEYDRLFDELSLLEREHPELRTPDSPTQRVGSDLSSDFPEVSHTIPVLSLDKAYSDTEILSWIKKTAENTGENLSFVLEEKLDGFSIVLYYEQGLLVRAVTRGNGYIGNDVTANVKTIHSVPLRLTRPVDIAVRGEVFLKKADFEKINSTLSEPYANPRNLAAGTIRRNKSNETAQVPLSIYVYEGFWTHSVPFTDHIMILSELNRLGFPVDKHLSCFCRTREDAQKRLEEAGLSGTCGSFEDIPSAITANAEGRNNLPYEIDGLVVKVNELAIREVLGYTEHHPRWAIAYKFEAPQAQTQVLGIDIQVGRTGRITPMARIRETLLSGSTIRNITLHNQDYVDSLELAVGDTVSISKRGDVIPAVENVIEKNNLGNTTWKMPKACPICGSSLVVRGAHMFCPNYDCPAQAKGRLTFFCAKGQMDIEGLGPRTVEILYDNGFVKNISELYEFDFGRLSSLDGFGGTEGRKIESIKMAVERSRKTPFRKVLVSLGIPEFGKKAVDLVCDAGLNSIDRLLSLADRGDEEKLSRIHGIGPITAKLIIDGLNSDITRKLIEDLRKAGLQMTDIKEKGSSLEQIFSGQSWCVTGSFENFNPRGRAMEEIKKRGGTEVSGVSGKTSCLLAGSGAGSKLDKAKKLGVRIVDEKEFLKLIGFESTEESEETVQKNLL